VGGAKGLGRVPQPRLGGVDGDDPPRARDHRGQADRPGADDRIVSPGCTWPFWTPVS
jgi:hypothetical protein